MKIMLDARPAYGGTARYVGELARLLEGALPPDSVILLGRSSRNFGATQPAKRNQARRFASLLLGPVWRVWTDSTGIARRVNATGTHLFHATMGVIPRHLPVPAVMTCYDLWPLDHAAERPGGWRARYEQAALLQALHRARHIIAISDTTARGIRTRLGPTAPPITRIYPPLVPPAPPVRPAGSLPTGPFWLSVGTLEPRKNLARLIEAQGAAFPVTGMPLVLAGRHGWGVDEVLQTVRRSQGAVQWLGPVWDGELEWLYAQAFGAIQFSRDEGFDYPAVEAMRAGIPVLLSDIAVHREVGDTVALYAAPHDATALTALMIECAGRPRAWRLAVGAAGKARADALAAQTQFSPYLAVYEQAMSAKPSSPVCSGRSA